MWWHDSCSLKAAESDATQNFVGILERPPADFQQRAIEQWTAELKDLLSKGESEFINILHHRTMVQQDVHTTALASQARRKRNKVRIHSLPFLSLTLIMFYHLEEENTHVTIRLDTQIRSKCHFFSHFVALCLVCHRMTISPLPNSRSLTWAFNSQTLFTYSLSVNANRAVVVPKSSLLKVQSLPSFVWVSSLCSR